MKTLTLLFALIIASAAESSAQQQPKSLLPACWVIESTVKNPRVQTVKFYDSRQRLLYQETVNQKLNIRKAIVRARLDDVLARLLANRTIPPGDSLETVVTRR